MFNWLCPILLILLAVSIILGLIIGVTSLRRGLLSKPIFNWFKKILPPMSETEKEAIDAGDIWFEAELFSGKPNWEKFLANPKPTLTDEEQDFLQNEVETLCAMVDEWSMAHNLHDFPPEIWNYIKTAGFLGLHVPKTYGGKQFSALASSTVVQKIATKSLSAAITVMVPNSLGPAELILHYGTEEQKQTYLHKLARGSEMPCFALTAPEAGSDATSISDHGIVCRGDYAGQKNVLGLRLNWDKRYITLAPIATLIGLAVKIFDPEHLLGDKEELGITVVLVPRDVAGIEIGNRHFPLEQAFMNGPIRGKNVFLPLDCIIGGTGMLGKGWQMLTECLASGRGISLPALSAAIGKQCFRMTGAYAKIRQQFNLSIGNFEGVSAKLAEIAGNAYLIEATRLLTLCAVDQKIKPSVVTAISKYHLTEMSRRIINAAMDVHGGRGIMLGPRNYLATAYEGVPISITVEGANVLTRCLMIYGQGAIRCHPYVLKEMTAAMDPDAAAGLVQFDQAFWRHMYYFFSTFAKMKLHSYTGAIFAAAPENTPWRRYYQWLSFFSIALAGTSDVAMFVLGGNLKRKENLSARLGDVLSYLYMASAVLKYDQDNGNQYADRIYVKWSLDYCLYNIQYSFDNFIANFPGWFWAASLRFIILPPWRKFRLPTDKLELEMSQGMMINSEFRDRLTSYCITTNDPNDAIGKIQSTWLKMLAVEPLLQKIQGAIKQGIITKTHNFELKIEQAVKAQIISPAQANELREFEKMRLDAIQVDEFTPAELTGKRK